MCHFKETEHGCQNIIFILGDAEPPFRANLLFGYAQSGSERTSFSGSTVRSRGTLDENDPTLSRVPTEPQNRFKQKDGILKS